MHDRLIVYSARVCNEPQRDDRFEFSEPVVSAPSGEDARMSLVSGGLVLLVGLGLISAPYWSATLPTSDYPIVLILGVIFAGFGAYTCLPERYGKTRTFVFAFAICAFGLVCAALAFTPFVADADGTYAIGGISGFRLSTPMPLWARAVAAFFAAIFLPIGVVGIWGVLRAIVRGDPRDNP
jgi:predicted small integral membrane protein